MYLMKRMIVSTPIVVALSAALGACGGPTEAPEAVPGPFLYGLTAQGILQIRDRLKLPYDDVVLLERMQAPFSCALYGGLCALVGPEATARIGALEWTLALDGRTVEEIDAALDIEIESATDTYAPLGVPEGALGALAAFGTSKFYMNATTTRRAKVVRGTVNPVIGKSHSKVVVTPQRKSGLIWIRTDASFVRAETHSRRRVTQTWFGPPVIGPSTVFDDPRTDVDSGTNTNRETAKALHVAPWNGWGSRVITDPSAGIIGTTDSDIDQTFSEVRYRAISGGLLITRTF